MFIRIDVALQDLTPIMCSAIMVLRIPETWKLPMLLNPTNDWNGVKRLNDWNVWNGPVPVMNGALAIERLERVRHFP